MNGCRILSTQKATKQRAKPLGNGSAAKRARFNGNPKFRAPGRPKTKSKSIQNGNTSQTNETDEESLRLAFNSMLPADIVQNGGHDDDKTNGTPNGSPSIKQKVKYIPPNQFVHIKPPPLNTQKIYVKQQNGNQSYTLGVKNIGTTDAPLIHNKLITVKNKEQINPSPNKTDEEISITEDTTINDIDIFDIPILFADKDGNIIDDNQTSNETPKTSVPQTPSAINSIEIISEEIVNGTIIGE